MNEHLVKVGGAHLDDAAFVDDLAEYLREMLSAQARIVLVHGGGREIAELHAALSLPSRKEVGLRITSEEGMRLVAMVLAGLVNKRLVAHLNGSGLRTLGVCGADLGILEAEFLNYEQLGRVGGPPRVRVNALRDLLRTAEVLVVSPICQGPDRALVNVNADLVAQTLAVALGVTCLDFVTDVPGVRTQGDTARRLAPDEITDLIGSSVVAGGMIPKLHASIAALDGGVANVRVGNIHSLRSGTATVVHA